MPALTYDIWCKPDRGGPLTVQERDSKGRWCWEGKIEAIQLAKNKKAQYPHMDFVVREEQGYHGPYAIVYDTSKPEKCPHCDFAGALLHKTTDGGWRCGNCGRTPEDAPGSRIKG